MNTQECKAALDVATGHPAMIKEAQTALKKIEAHGPGWPWWHLMDLDLQFYSGEGCDSGIITTIHEVHAVADILASHDYYFAGSSAEWHVLYGDNS